MLDVRLMDLLQSPALDQLHDAPEGSHPEHAPPPFPHRRARCRRALACRPAAGQGPGMTDVQARSSPLPSADAAAPFPIRMGSAEEFAQVRNFFRSAEFDDATVCRALAIDAMSDMGSVRWDEVRLDSLSALLRWCIETFVRGTPPPAQESRALCGEEAFAAFLSLGLLRAARHDPGAIVSPIWLYPIAGFIVVSDRHDGPEGET